MLGVRGECEMYQEEFERIARYNVPRERRILLTRVFFL